MKTFQVIQNATSDESEYALYDVDKKTIIMSGDYYHDKIYDLITGFFQGLKYVKYQFIRLNDIELKPEDNIELWNSCEFQDER